MIDRLTGKQIEEIEIRANNATRGPWERGIGNNYREVTQCFGPKIADVYGSEDGWFIAHARDDIPRLIKEVKRLDGLIEAISLIDNSNNNLVGEPSRSEIVDTLREIIEKKTEDITKLEDKFEDVQILLERMQQWCDAYPLDMFPEPDLKLARALLAAGGITLDSVTVYAMRHVVNGMRGYVEEAIKILPGG